MKRFIPLSFFRDLYENYTDLLSDEEMVRFRERVAGEQGKKICAEHAISKQELDAFLKTIENPTSIVFYGWISYSTNLTNFLLDKGVIEAYEDTFNHLIHQLSEEYQSFITPYLVERLLVYSNEQNVEILQRAFSYVILLDESHRSTLESQLFKSVSNDLQKLKSQIKNAQTEQELIDFVQPLCSTYIIDSVNLLSKASYALKLNYVDQLLNVINADTCTVRFANWILKQLESLELNREHEHKILELKKALEQGELSVKNQGSGSVPFQWKKIVLATAFIALIGFVYYVVYYKPFSTVKQNAFIQNSSFKEFTKEERKQIDSLLKDLDGKIRTEDLFKDQGAPLIGTSTTLSLKTPFTNKNMESIYMDLIKDDDLKRRGFIDSCKVNTHFKRRDEVKNLLKKKGSVAAMIRNDSEYASIIYVAEESSLGLVYSFRLDKDEIKVFEINPGEIITIVAGNKFQKYQAPSTVKSDLPSHLFTHHFCETDANYRETINTSYRVIEGVESKIKFLLTGKRGEAFNLLDLKAALETL